MQLTFQQFMERVPKHAKIVAHEAFTGKECFTTEKPFVAENNYFADYTVWNSFTFYGKDGIEIEYHISLLNNNELSESKEGGDYGKIRNN